MKFSFVNPTQIHFGQGQIARIASAIPRDARVLLLYGGGSIKRNGVYEQAVAALEGFTWQEFAGVEPNPTVETLNRAVEQVKAEGLSYILAVGGGSVIDGAKYVAATVDADVLRQGVVDFAGHLGNPTAERGMHDGATLHVTGVHQVSGLLVSSLVGGD